VQAETLWVAGGLYGNPFALQALLERYDAEPGSKALVFNGDFHWFDVAEEQFAEVEEGVARHSRTRGNVETELAAPVDAGGCGCGYPEWVDEDTVRRSNEIIARLASTARRFPAALGALAALPMHLAADVGGERVAVVHGDATSLAGWGFSQEALATGEGWNAALHAFARAGARVFASSHTCLPVLQAFPGERWIANNGAAGMPNFEGELYGLATRISVRRAKEALYSARAGNVFVEAMPLRYDVAAWGRRFVEQWPAGSPAHASYHQRIAAGPRYRLAESLRPAPARAA